MALTKHKEGSIQELWSIALPLMFSSLSVMLMLFVDRILLANVSSRALNAAVNAATMGWAFIFGWMVMTAITEVFVAQLNGSGQKERLGQPVWQMLWLSLGSMFCFVPLAYWGGEFFFGSEFENILERSYFFWMMLFSMSYPVYGALCGFFIGQGKTLVITLLAIATNLVNLLFDVILIFGIEGWISPMGVEGAAIATSGSSLFQVAVLGYIFLNKENRTTRGTGNWRIDIPLFWQCFKVGLPGAIFVAVEILGWGTFYWMMAKMGETYITVAGICQSVVILFFFFAEGVNKAITAIAGNLIGAKKDWIIPQVVKSGLVLHLLFFLCLSVVLFSIPDFIIGQFLPNASPEWIAELRMPLITCFMCNVFYLLFEGLRLLFSGVLTAAGDTMFLLIAGSISVWVLFVLPVYLFVVLGESRIELASFIGAVYSLLISAIYYWRFRGGSWKSIKITA